jgi:hypothetical protein
LLLHLLQGPGPARVHLFDVVEQGFQVAANDRQGRAQFMGDVGDEILAHLFQLMDARHVPHQHQMLVVAVAREVQLDAQPVVGRRRNLQRLGVVFLLEIFLEARMTHQVGHRLAAVLGCLEAQQGFRGAVPPFQVAVAVEHDHRVLERRGGFLDPVDHRLQTAANALVAALQVINAVEHLTPQAIAVGWCFLGFVQAQPLMQAQQLLERPGQVKPQARSQAPAVVAADQADDQTAGHQQQHVANQGAMPVLIQLNTRPCQLVGR